MLHAAHRRDAWRAPIFDALVDQARAAVAALDGFPRHYPRFVLEQAAIAGALNPEILVGRRQGGGSGATISPAGSTRCREEFERGWHGEPTPDGGLKFWREVRGVREAVAIDGALIASADARKLDRMAAELQADLSQGRARCKRKDETREMRSPDATAETRSSNGAARACRCSATRAWAK